MKLRTRLVSALVALAIPLVALAQWLRADIEQRAAVTSVADFARSRMEAGGRRQCESSPSTFRDPSREMEHGPPRPGGDEREDRPPGSARTGRPPPPTGERGGPGPPRDANPGVGQGPPTGPRFEMFTYGADFASANPSAPAFPAELRHALESGARESGFVRDISLRDSRERSDVIGKRSDVIAAVKMTWDSGPCAIMLAWRHDKEPGAGLTTGVGYAALIVGGLLVSVFFAIGPVERRVRRLTAGVQRSAADRYRTAVAVEGRDEIGDLARAFNAAGAEVRVHIEEVEKRERALRDFVQNTTHDVMLPLTVLQGHLSELRDALAGGTQPDMKTAREALEESHYLASLVQNMGTAAELEAGRPEAHKDPFSWNQLVERVVMRHGPIARHKDVELDFVVPEEDVRAEGDVTLVEQALSNVVHNAVRYNTAGGHVAVLLDAEGGRFSARVIDDGPGVADAELARLAERTFRSDAARARDPAGRGLGLSIAKDVAEQHGFTLELRKAEAGGLEVEIAGPALAA